MFIAKGIIFHFLLDMFSCLMSLSNSKNYNNQTLTSSAELLIKKGARIDDHDR